MSMDDLGSRSDLDALRRSGRGKFILVALLLVAALAAAVWAFWLRKRGTGNKEDPAKVMVVTGTRGLSLVLADGGFEAVEGTFDAWVSKAQDEVPDLDVGGIEAIMTLADRFGYGHVIFERPQEIDFAPLDIDGGVPEFPDHVRFAVLTAGDLAFPHVMTVNPVPSKVMRGTGIVLLQALFEQEALKPTLDTEDTGSMDVVKLRDRLRDAVEKLQRIPAAERMAEKIVGEVDRQLDEGELAEPKPHRMADALSSMRPIPLANGEVLGIERRFQVVTRDAVHADLDLEDEELFTIGTASIDPDARASCEALAGGQISVHESPRYSFGDHGDALLVHTLSGGYVLWTLDAKAPGCAFVRTGELAAPDPGLSAEALPHGSGNVARIGEVDGQATIVVVDAKTGQRTDLARLDEARIVSAAWLDDRRLGAIVRYDDDADALALVDVERPDSVLLVRGTLFENANTLGEVTRVRLGDRPVLAVTAGGHPRRLYRLDLPAALDALFAAPPASEAEPPQTREGLPSIVTLHSTGMTATALTTEGEVYAPVAAPDGRAIAFVLTDSGLDERNPDDAEIGLVDIDAGGGGKGLRLLTRNALRDGSPRFSADGRHVVFETRVEIPKTEWHITAARAVSVAD